MKDDALKKRQRVAGICATLAKGEGIRVPDLATRYRVSEKTIRRDLDDIMAAGIQLRSERGTWLLVGPPPRAGIGVELTTTEAVALCFAVNCYQGMPSPPMATEVEKAVEKLRTMLPPGVEGALAASCSRYSIALPTAAGYEGKQDIVDTIEWALEHNLVLSVLYLTQAGGDEESYQVEPYALHFAAGHWYLIARCRERGEMIMLRVDRISECAELADEFERRSDFSINDFLDHVWRTVCGGLSAW